MDDKSTDLSEDANGRFRPTGWDCNDTPLPLSPEACIEGIRKRSGFAAYRLEFGPYGTKGCYAYKDTGSYTGRAFFGLGGTKAQQCEDPNTDTKFRPANIVEACQGQ